MTRLLLALLAALAVGGCDDPYRHPVTETERTRAAELCAPFGGVDLVIGGFVSDAEDCFCHDRAWVPRQPDCDTACAPHGGSVERVNARITIPASAHCADGSRFSIRGRP